jgi:RecB family exonuclease
MTGLPPSAEIRRLSPTSFEVLRECPLRFSYGQQGTGTGQGSPAAFLGTVCHNVLDRAVKDKLLLTESWKSEIDRLWQIEVDAGRANRAESGSPNDPARWPGYQLKRARLFQVAGRVRALLGDLPASCEVLTEVSLESGDGLLYGRADLVIRGDRHQIIDYKSGGVLDRETSMPREAYVRQLQLYAYLEQQTSGSWPTSAHLFPLQGAPVEIDVESSVSAALAAEAREALAAYNAIAPGVQRAEPTPEHCRWCSASSICPAFWAACDESWAPAMSAVAGAVTRAFETKLGGVTIYVEPEAGSLGRDPVAIKNISADALNGAVEIGVGERVAVCGLFPDAKGFGFWVGAGGSIAVSGG